MSKLLDKLQNLCNYITEGEDTKTVNVLGVKYNTDDVVKFARSYDRSVITVIEALKLISGLGLENEIHRLLNTSDPAYDYVNHDPNLKYFEISCCLCLLAIIFPFNDS